MYDFWGDVKMSKKTLPLYEVKELTVAEIILSLATEHEKQKTIYKDAVARFLQLFNNT